MKIKQQHPIVGLLLLAAFSVSLSFGQDRIEILKRAEAILNPCLELVSPEVSGPLVERFKKAKENPDAFSKADGVAFLKECVAALDKIDIAEEDQPKVVRLKAFLKELTKPQEE